MKLSILLLTSLEELSSVLSGYYIPLKALKKREQDVLEMIFIQYGCIYKRLPLDLFEEFRGGFPGSGTK